MNEGALWPVERIHQLVATDDGSSRLLIRIMILAQSSTLNRQRIPIIDHPIRILEVDLKGPPAGPAPVSKLDPVTVDGRHYKVEFENEQVRVLRIHFEPREKGPTHEHILNRVVLYLNDQTAAKADDVRMAGPATHAEENASDQPADRIAVELK